MDKHGTWAAAGGVALGLAALGRRSPGQPFATATAAAAGGLYLARDVRAEGANLRHHRDAFRRARAHLL